MWGTRHPKCQSGNSDSVLFVVGVDDLRRNPTAVRNLVSVLTGPCTNSLILFPVDAGGTRSRLRAGTRVCALASPLPAGVLDILRQRIAKFLGILTGQIDLVSNVVQTELNRFVGVIPIEIVDERDECPRCHEYPPVSNLLIVLRCGHRGHMNVGSKSLTTTLIRHA